ncbi:MAG: glycosyltransferase [Desulfatirhabdiaceae bacterium]
MVSQSQQNSSAPNGVSIIILTRDAAPLLDRLLTSFFDVNTHRTVELIVIDHGSGDETGHVIARNAHKGFIRHINRCQNFSFANSCNHGAATARYPYLLFLNNDIIYTSDALPSALSKLEQESTIGGVGIRLDDDPASLPKETVPGIQHLGIEFKWNEKRGYFQPEQIRRPDSKTASLLPSSLFPAVTGAFLLCRKTDFQALKGFSEDYVYGLEDIDFCLRMGRDLKKTCWCIHDMSLQHVEGATRRLGDKTERAERIEANHRIFKEWWGGYIRELLDGRPAGDMAERLPAASHPAVVRQERNSQPTLRILFVLPQPIDSNCGYHVERLAAGLQAQGVECIAAVPQTNPSPVTSHQSPVTSHQSPVTSHLSLVTRSYTEIQKNGIPFSNGQGPDIIHAWTPREGVRQFVASLTAKTPCPVVIHLEDNEEYLTETAVGRPFSELAKLSIKELDKIIPHNRYHPVHGRRFLEQAQGLTMIIDTLEKFNFAHVPSLTILPPVDERLFYPRPINHGLRNKLGISKNHIVLVYCGNVHAGNREEVLTLYQAVRLLNQQGHPTTLIRTGINAVPLTDGDDAWIKNFEIPLGWVSREELPDIMAAADIFVQPGMPGPFNDYRIPCKLPEYFAMGRPVVLPKTNLGLKLQHGVEGYVMDKADADAVAGVVREICEKQDMASTLAVSAMVFYRSTLYVRNMSFLLDHYACAKFA